MSAVIALLAGIALGLLQVGAAPPLFGDPLAAPLLPIAAVAGWTATRSFGRAAPALLGAALVLGVASEERAGWFVLAALPAAALCVAAGSAPPLKRLLATPVAAGLGAALYVASLYLVAGHPELVASAREQLLAATVWTAGAAAVVAVVAWPLRPRPPAGLFR